MENDIITKYIGGIEYDVYYNQVNDKICHGSDGSENKYYNKVEKVMNCDTDNEVIDKEIIENLEIEINK